MCKIRPIWRAKIRLSGGCLAETVAEAWGCPVGLILPLPRPGDGSECCVAKLGAALFKFAQAGADHRPDEGDARLHVERERENLGALDCRIEERVPDWGSGSGSGYRTYAIAVRNTAHATVEWANERR